MIKGFNIIVLFLEFCRYYSDKEILDRVPSCFLLLGACYAVLQLIGSMLITFPPTEAGEYKQVLYRRVVFNCHVMIVMIDRSITRP